MGSDFKELSERIMKTHFPDMSTKVLLFGKTKIFMRIEA